MRSILHEFENIPEEELSALALEHAARLEGTNPDQWDAAQIQAAFEWMHALTQTGEHKLSSAVFHKLETAVQGWHSKHPGDSEAIGFFYEWGLMAIQLTPESKEQFVCIQLYRDLFEAIMEGPVTQHYRAVELKLQLLQHYNFWLERGGKAENLLEEDALMLDDAQPGFEGLYEDITDAAEEREDFDSACKLYRIAARYYFAMDQPNDGIGCLKAILEDLPNTSDYVPAAKGELLIEIGKVFMGFNKPSAALKYFQEAMEVYQTEGEEYEIQFLQAESWKENAIKTMNS